MEKEVKKEDLANPAAAPENLQPDPLIEELNDDKEVTTETMQEEQEEVTKSLKQG